MGPFEGPPTLNAPGFAGGYLPCELLCEVQQRNRASEGKSPLPWQKRCRGDNPQGAFFASRLRTSRTTLSDRAKLDVTLLYDRAESQLEGRIRPERGQCRWVQKSSRPCENSARSARTAPRARGRFDSEWISGFRLCGASYRVWSVYWRRPGARGNCPPPGGERGRHCLDAHDVERTAQIVDERRQTEFGAHLFEAARQERALVHPLFDRAERVFDRLAAAVENYGLDLRRAAMRSSASSCSRRETAR